MYFVAMTFRLEPLNDASSTDIQASIHSHAAVMHAISLQDENLGRELHDMQRHKSFTVAVIGRNGGRLLLRLTFMGTRGLDAAHAAVNGFTRSPVIHLGRSRYRVTDLCMSGSPWTGINSWADLDVQPSFLRFEFTFVTLTAFRMKGGSGRPFISLYPDPSTLFRGLADRWQALNGPTLPDTLNDFITQGGCVVSSHCLHTKTIRLKERTQVDFLGTTTYECLDSDTAHVAALNQLTRFAFFAGVGYQTARGMGVVATRVLA